MARVEQGRGCNRAVAKKMAEALGVDLDELRAESGAEDAGTRYVHKAYLKLLLERVVGSAYAVLEEWELEELVEGLPAEELVGACCQTHPAALRRGTREAHRGHARALVRSFPT